MGPTGVLGLKIAVQLLLHLLESLVPGLLALDPKVLLSKKGSACLRNKAESGSARKLGGVRRTVSAVSLRVACEDAVDVARVQGDIPTPASESAVGVDGLDPFVEVLPLGSVLVAVPALRFQHQHVA